MHRKTIQIDQQEISYLDSGDAPKTLVFIHGMGCNAFTWKNQLNEFSNLCRCIAIDLPAHGFSPKLQFKISIYNYVELLYKFIRTLGLKDVHLVAHSMAGQISLMYALKYAPSLEKLYLIAPAGFEKFNTYESNLIIKSLDLLNLKPMLQNIKLLSTWLPPKEASTQELFYCIQQGSSEENLQNYLASIAQCTKAMLDEPIHGFVQNLNVNLRIAYGLMDKMIPNPIFLHKRSVDFPKTIQTLVPSAQLFELKNSGHFPQLESFNAINADIKSYFSL